MAVNRLDASCSLDDLFKFACAGILEWLLYSPYRFRVLVYATTHSLVFRRSHVFMVLGVYPGD